MIEIEQSAELVACTPEPERMLERIARVCYNSEERMECDCADGNCQKCRTRREKFLGGLKERRHDSVFEHAVATFKLVTDRGITHELVRHRLASYTQSSTRYIKYDEGIPVVRPFFSSPGEEAPWREAMLSAEKAYQTMLSAGIPAEKARDVLPTCTATTIFATANFREWRHIFKLRMGRGAHPKIRALAHLAWEKMAPLCPVYFADLEAEYTS
jgi:thymidylate synthase, flavin-dependent